jgi:hypothetical protein
VTNWKLPTVLVAVAAIVLGATVAGGSETAHARTTSVVAAKTDTHPAAAAPGGTWSKATPVPGLRYIDDLTCTSPGNCLAVGGPDIAAERGGVWHPAQVVSGLRTLGAAASWLPGTTRLHGGRRLQRRV